MTRGRAAAAPPTKKTKLTERPFCSYLGEGTKASGVESREAFANNSCKSPPLLILIESVRTRSGRDDQKGGGGHAQP